ncbi:hypothetical protein ACFVIM_26725 [Streptomyces sp. NPDC057638]|uniref:hypothetical protein n=1 Tax=Streptomyces sp. NPDC057638 TaxID=3346190 RepID=UPI0036A3B5A2
MGIRPHGTIRRTASGALAGAVAAAAVLLGSAPSAATATAVERAEPAPGATKASATKAVTTTLTTGDRVEVEPGARAKGAFRLVPQDPARPAPYIYARAGGTLEIRPTGRATQNKKPLKATTVRAGAQPKAAPRSAATSQTVRIQLAGASHEGPVLKVWNRATWAAHPVQAEQFGTGGTASLPPGDYLTAGVYTAPGQPSLLLTESFTVRGTAVTVTLDATRAQEVALSVDEPTARLESGSVWLRMPNGDVVGSVGGAGETVRVTPFTLPGVALRVQQVLVKSGSTANHPSPYRYDLFHSFQHTIPASPTASVRTADLAKTTTTLRPQGPGTTGSLLTWRSVGDGTGGSAISPARFPSTVTEYVTPGTSIRHAAGYAEGGSLEGTPRTLTQGDNPGLSFGAAPFAQRPCAGRSTFTHWRITIDERCAFGDGVGNQGWDPAAVQDLTVQQSTVTHLDTRGRKLTEPVVSDISSWGQLALTQTIRRTGSPDQLSPVQITKWTLDRPDIVGPLLLTDVGLRVDGLDDHHRASASPVTIEATASSRAGSPADVREIQYSTDSGTTWLPLTLTPNGQRATAQLTVPADAAHISLRATATSGTYSVVRVIQRAFAGPAATYGESAGTIAFGAATVNDGQPLAPEFRQAPGAPSPYAVRYKVTDPAGVAASGARLYRGTPDRPDAVLHTGPAICVKENDTTSDCYAELPLGSTTHLGRHDLTGEWKLAAWARSRDGVGHISRADLATTQILRQSRITISGPTAPVFSGSRVTLTGVAGLADWPTARWTALPGASVTLESRRTGTTAWTPATTVTAGPDGTVTATVRPTADADWRWVMPKNGEVEAAVSPTHFVNVL